MTVCKISFEKQVFWLGEIILEKKILFESLKIFIDIKVFVN